MVSEISDVVEGLTGLPDHLEILTKEKREFFEEMGYSNCCKINGKIVGLSSFIYTTAIVVGMDETGYEHRFCYHTPHTAMEGLLMWVVNGGDEPTGYIKRKG